MDTERINHLATLYAAVAEPTRLRILGLLAERDATGTELSDYLGLSAPTVSHHMSRLVAAGLVSATADGPRRRYRLERESLRPRVGTSRPTDEDPLAAAEKIRRDFFDGERLVQIPAARKKRVVILRHLLLRFDSERDYSEREINDLLRLAHEDVATLRRELVDYGFLIRRRGIYRVADRLPNRDGTVRQETGDDEATWFAGLMNSATKRALDRNTQEHRS